MTYTLTFRKIFKLLVMTGLAHICLSQAHAGEKLAASEIRKIVPGTYNVSVADSVSAVAVLTAGGSISIVTNKGEKDSGRWSISGNKICVKFKHLLDRQFQCSSLTLDGPAIRGNGFTARRN